MSVPAPGAPVPATPGPGDVGAGRLVADPDPAHPGPGTPKVVAGFFSFTEVEAGAHRSYNEWHLFDHLPEQFVLAGIAGGWRWVRPPTLAERSVATAPLDRTHYVTLYLLADPLDQALVEFREHGVALARAGRFHQQRTSHLAGPLLVESQWSSPRVLVAPAAVPFRPGTGLHVRVAPERPSAGTASNAGAAGRPASTEGAASQAATGSNGTGPTAAGPNAASPAATGSSAAGSADVDPDVLLDVPGVAGVWSFAGTPPGASGPFAAAVAGLRVTCAWLDGDPLEVDAVMAATCPPPAFAPDGAPGFVGTLAAIDPHGPFDWFDR